VQARLGFAAGYFAKGDPAPAYLKRAVRLLPTDPQLWYSLGLTQQRAGQPEEALASWKRSLELSPEQLRLILSQSAAIPPAALSAKLLPDDPQVLVQSANLLYPDTVAQAAPRRVLLLRAFQPHQDATLKPLRAVAISEAGDELGEADAVDRMWTRLLNTDPTDAVLHNGAAEFYERNERYTEAIKHLNWLSDYNVLYSRINERLRVARHGAQLQDIIFGK